MKTSQFQLADCILTAQHIAGYGIQLTATGSPEDLEQLEDCLVHCCPSIEQYLTDKCFRFGHVTLPESFDLHTIESFTEQQHIQEELLIQGSPVPSDQEYELDPEYELERRVQEDELDQEYEEVRNA